MQSSKKIFWSAISGNILEYYDFTVYAVFAAIIGKSFFPAESELIQIILSLATFALGFLTRPIGGIVFGYIGDKYGRRVSLIISMCGMTIPTFIMGLIPSYQDIGVYAPITLIIMRLVQGLCISGEGAGAAIFILEHQQNLKPGFTSGLVHGSNIAGTLIATFVGIIIETFFNDIEFAWRFAFLLGGFMGLVGFYLRLRVSETPIFKMLAEKKKSSKAPFFEVFKYAKTAMFISFCLGGAASSVVYFIKAYLKYFYNHVLNLDNTTSLFYLSYAAFVMMIAMPLSGLVADLIGRFRMIVVSSIIILLFSFPVVLLMVYATSTLEQLIALTAFGILAGSISGTAYSFIIGLFTPEYRFSGIGFSYNLGIATFGAPSAVIHLWMIHVTNLQYAPAFYLLINFSLFLILLYFMRNFIKKTVVDN